MPSGATSTCCRRSAENCGRSPSRSSSDTTSNSARWILALSARRGDVPVHLQPIDGEYVGIRAHVGRRVDATWPATAAHHRARNGHRGGGRRTVAGAPSACPTTTRGSRRSTAGCFPSASSTCCGTGKRSNASLISTNVLPEYQRHGRRPGVDGRAGAQGHRMGDGRGGVFLGPRIQFALLRRLKKGGRRSPRRIGCTIGKKRGQRREGDGDRERAAK